MKAAPGSRSSEMYPAPHEAGAVLHIDISALIANYRYLQARAAHAQVAGVVKADAYGLGLAPVAQALFNAGCRHFFVAHGFEGIALRALLPHAVIYILNGVPADEEERLLGAKLVPVVNSLDDLAVWRRHARISQNKIDIALHLDTGINRLGLPPADAEKLSSVSGALKGLNLVHVMSHFACADTPLHEMNGRQLSLFNRLRAGLPVVPASMANSAACLTNPDSHLDWIRAGIALYGGNPFSRDINPMRAVATLKARILQKRHMGKGETVGYGATYMSSGDIKLATASIGYADGLPRLLSNKGRGFFEGYGYAPIVGRVSMDSITLDVSQLPDDACKVGDWVELMGAHVGVDEVANLSETISYEVLTGFTSRVARNYAHTPPEDKNA